METILITGGTGLVGKQLSKILKEKGYQVAIVSRTRKQYSDVLSYSWNLEKKEIEKGAVENSDYIIHLAGANLGTKRWSKKRKQEIIESRVKTAQLIFEKIKENKNKLKAFISASAIGYYGAVTSDKVFYESNPPYNDFSSETCRQWEQAADKFADLKIRTVKIRTGIVLSKQNGALSKMVLPVKMGIGSPIGSGKQYMPWIHIDDLCGIYLKAIADAQMHGAYNAVSPDIKTNKDFIRTVAKILHKPFWFPNVPGIAMKIIFGSMSEMLLTGSRVSPGKIIKAGYNFVFPQLENALIDLLRKS